MKTLIKKSFAFLTILVFTVSCNKQPMASFVTNDSALIVDQAITFTNTSLECFSYSWEFGDGTKSTEQNPMHTYSDEGVYEVTLIAYSEKEKKSDEFKMTIEVKKNTDQKITILWEIDPLEVNTNIDELITITE